MRIANNSFVFHSPCYYRQATAVPGSINTWTPTRHLTHATLDCTSGLVVAITLVKMRRAPPSPINVHRDVLSVYLLQK